VHFVDEPRRLAFGSERDRVGDRRLLVLAVVERPVTAAMHPLVLPEYRRLPRLTQSNLSIHPSEIC
jgi:hypothetical protein